uniref:Uncharacterized protein n=1 Tax=Octopus bimaculoides TaxID=37653 RepID=A0A0L8GYX2_OCTBM
MEIVESVKKKIEKENKREIERRRWRERERESLFHSAFVCSIEMFNIMKQFYI